MTLGTKIDIRQNHKTIYVGTSDAALLSAGNQSSELTEGVGGTATFALSGLNVDWSTVTAEWDEGLPADLEANMSYNGKTLTVTADASAKEGTYSLTPTADGTASGKTASKTVTVTVSGVPLRITEQPQGVTWRKGESAVSIHVTTEPTDGVSYQWKLTDGTELSGQTGSELNLSDIPEDKLTPSSDKSCESTAQVCCTVTRNGYSLDSDAATVIISTCDHARHYGTDGKCTQCGAVLSDDYTFVGFDGIPYNGSMVSDKVGPGETIYLLKDITGGDPDLGDTLTGFTMLPDATIDLNGHTIGGISVDEFQNTTIQNGTILTLNLPEGSGEDMKNAGTLTLKNVTVESEVTIGSGTTLTVVEGCVFEGHVTVSGDTRLTGGTFKRSLSDADGNITFALLADGYAYAINGKVLPLTGLPLNTRVDIIPHTCATYQYGECTECGRHCSHPGVADGETCPTCGAAAKPFSIGSSYYATLEDALAAASNGETILLHSDYRLRVTDGVEIQRNITLDLGENTLSADCPQRARPPYRPFRSLRRM